MKLAVSNIAWSSKDDETLYSYLNRNGFEGLEIAPTRIVSKNPYDQIKKIGEFSNDLKSRYNLDICSLQSILYGRDENIFFSNDEKVRILDYLKKAIDFASSISCNNLVFGSPKNRNLKNKDQYQIAVDFFRELGEYSFKKGTVLSIEANPKIYGTTFINTTKEAFNLCKDVNSRGFKVNFDMGTDIENGFDITLIKDNFKMINHIHISEPYLDIIKKRDIHNELYELVKDIYSKYISIEMKNPNNLDHVKKSIDYIRSIFVPN